MQVIRKRCKEFREEMDSEVIATKLFDQELIPERVKRCIMQSMSIEDANSSLLDFLKKKACTDQVLGILKVAAEEKGYGRMNAFANGILQEIQQGLQ